jgi:hypothetical protein
MKVYEAERGVQRGRQLRKGAPKRRSTDFFHILLV